jgi:hypothetical protein
MDRIRLSASNGEAVRRINFVFYEAILVVRIAKIAGQKATM